MTVTTLMTADELIALPRGTSKYELVQGELRKFSLAGEAHGNVSVEISLSLGNYVKQRKLGRVYPADTGFRLARDPDTVRAPDVSFVRAERVKRTPRYIEGAPDVAFEVVSPNDTYSEIEEKSREYLRAGTLAVVIVDPRTQVVRIDRPNGSTKVTEAIELPDIFPDWKLPLAELFA